MNRREFLKGIGAVLARLFVPRKAENQVPTLGQETCPIVSIPIDFYLPIPDDGVPLRREIDTGYREEARNNKPKIVQMEKWNLVGDPIQIELIQTAFDACKCAPMKWYFHSKCDIESGSSIHVTHDGGETWEYVGEIA